MRPKLTEFMSSKIKIVRLYIQRGQIIEFIKFRINYYFFVGSKLSNFKFNEVKIMFSGIKIIEFMTNY